jgi:hypothetical protein
MNNVGIKPIDFQMMVPKTSEVIKVQNEMNQRDFVIQSQITTANKHIIEHSLKKVNSTDEPYKPEIKEKSSEKQKQKKKDTNRKKQNGQTDEEQHKKNLSKDHSNDHIIDITI